MLIPSLVIIASAFLVSCEGATRYSSAYPNFLPYEIFEVKDCWFTLGGGTDYQFQRLGETIDQQNS